MEGVAEVLALVVLLVMVLKWRLSSVGQRGMPTVFVKVLGSGVLVLTSAVFPRS